MSWYAYGYDRVCAQCLWYGGCSLNRDGYPDTPFPVIGLITEWRTETGEIEQRDEHSDMGGTMRLAPSPAIWWKVPKHERSMARTLSESAIDIATR